MISLHKAECLFFAVMVHPTEYKLIIFDCDGTLVNSEPLTMRILSLMMRELGIERSDSALLEAFAGKNMKAITDFVSSHIGPFDENTFEEDYRQRCVQLFRKELQPIPGSIELIKSVKTSKCIASNGPHRKMKISLSATGINQYFKDEHIFSAYDIQKWKPDPALIYFALDRMKCKENEAILIEDTMSGVNAGLTAGITTLAYNPEQDQDLLSSGALNFSTMAEIKHYLNLV